MGLPHWMSWPSWVWWCSLNSSDQGTWASAVATTAAAAIALWLGVRDGLRRRADLKERGQIALAMSYPELSRISRMLRELVTAMDELIRACSSPPGFEVKATLDRVGDVSRKLSSPMTSDAIEHYVGMPKKFRFNLPTVIQALPQLERAREHAAEIIRTESGSKQIARLGRWRTFADSTLIDIRVAVEYIENTILPVQLKNMRPHMSTEQLAAAGDD